MMIHEGWKDNVCSDGSLLASKMNYNFSVSSLPYIWFVPTLVAGALSRMVYFHVNKEVTLLLCLCFLSSERTSLIEFLYVWGKIRIIRGIWWFFKIFPLPHMCIPCSIISRCMWKYTVVTVQACGRTAWQSSTSWTSCMATLATVHMQNWLNKPHIPVQDDGPSSTLLILSPVLTIRNATCIT
jgi:hypothetical protein